ncbi:WD repeat-containing protein [Dirofilaria immitis]
MDSSYFLDSAMYSSHFPENSMCIRSYFPAISMGSSYLPGSSMKKTDPPNQTIPSPPDSLPHSFSYRISSIIRLTMTIDQSFVELGRTIFHLWTSLFTHSGTMIYPDCFSISSRLWNYSLFSVTELNTDCYPRIQYLVRYSHVLILIFSFRQRMSNEKNADRNLYITDDILIGQHKMKDGKMIDEEKNNNEKTIDGISNAYTNDSSISAISLQSLDDDDFRNLLNTAAKPQYGSLQRKRKKLQKTTEYGGRRLSDAGENTGLSAEADNLLAQFRREAELNQRNADIGWFFIEFLMI